MHFRGQNTVRKYPFTRLLFRFVDKKLEIKKNVIQKLDCLVAFWIFCGECFGVFVCVCVCMCLCVCVCVCVYVEEYVCMVGRVCVRLYT